MIAWVLLLTVLIVGTIFPIYVLLAIAFVADDTKGG